MNESILVINTGSSSLKCGIYAPENGREKLLFGDSADGIAPQALDRAVEWLSNRGQPCAIGHRVVHGGPRLLAHQRITPAVVAELRDSLHFAPLHIPAALQLIEKAAKSYPEVPQFACFDTVFHRNMPETAARFPIPRPLFEEGVRRYGFHGISYESIVHQLGRSLPSRAVIAHLGSGASLVALKDGQSVDTTMAFTPTGGIPMATRSGDLDPGVLLYLLRVKQMNVASLEEMLNHESGLKALSGTSGDMRELEAAADAGDRKAQLAIDIFCISIRKTVAAYAAVLGGLDLLVFTGGIGEHSARIRAGVCEGLQFLGIPRVEVLPSQEDVQIARHARVLLREKY
jgi:acetate kinase